MANRRAAPCGGSCSQGFHSRSLGFTLIELMVVLLIISVFAGMVIPSVATALGRGAIDSSAEKISEVLSFASACAISHRRPMIVNINTRHGHVWLTRQITPLPWRKEADRETISERKLAAVQLPEHWEISVTYTGDSEHGPADSDGNEALIFDASGQTEDAVIEVTDLNGSTLKVELSGSTGFARVKRGAEE